MQISARNPEPLIAPRAFSQSLAVSDARRLIFVSGQVAMGADEQVIAPGDIAGQARAVFENLSVALAAHGASCHDLVKLTIFVVDLQPGDGKAIRAVREAYIDPAHPPAVSLIGVQRLAFEGLRLEIEATAATA